MAENKPLPCPFCGGEPHLENVLNGDFMEERQYFLICDSCAAEGPWAKNPFGAFRMWNTRAPSNTASTPTGGESTVKAASSAPAPLPSNQAEPVPPTSG